MVPIFYHDRWQSRCLYRSHKDRGISSSHLWQQLGIPHYLYTFQGWIHSFLHYRLNMLNVRLRTARREGIILSNTRWKRRKARKGHRGHRDCKRITSRNFEIEIFWFSKFSSFRMKFSKPKFEIFWSKIFEIFSKEKISKKFRTIISKYYVICLQPVSTRRLEKWCANNLP